MQAERHRARAAFAPGPPQPRPGRSGLIRRTLDPALHLGLHRALELAGAARAGLACGRFGPGCPSGFRDESADFMFLTRSTVTSNETIIYSDGKSYPLIRIEISSASHPFYTGTQRVVDTAGRVQRFEQRFGKRSR